MKHRMGGWGSTNKEGLGGLYNTDCGGMIPTFAVCTFTVSQIATSGSEASGLGPLCSCFAW